MIIMQDTVFVSFNVTVTITTISLVGKSVLINKWMHIRTSKCNQVNRHTIYTDIKSILQCKVYQEKYMNVLLLSFILISCSNTL